MDNKGFVKCKDINDKIKISMNYLEKARSLMYNNSKDSYKYYTNARSLTSLLNQ